MAKFLQKIGISAWLVILTGTPTWAKEEIASQTHIGSLQDVVSKIFAVLLAFVPGVATVYLILSGYRYIVSQGNQDLTEKAKKSLTYSVFGVIISYGSVAIIYTFAKAIGYK